MGFMEKVAPYALGGVLGGALAGGKISPLAAVSPAAALISSGSKKKKEPESMLNSGSKPRSSNASSMLY